MNTNQILCFLTVAKHKNYTNAAAELFLTQQAISRQILNLEQELNTQLFTREKGKTELTEAGLYYERLFSSWNCQLQQLQDKSRLIAQQAASRLTIGCSSWIDPFGELGRGIAHYQAKYPQIQLQMQSLPNEHLLDMLSQDELDLAILPGDQCPQDSSYQQAPLAKQHMCFFAPVDTDAKHMDPQCWSLPFLAVPAWNWNPLEWTRISRQELAELGIAPSRIITLPDVSALVSTFRLGNTVTLADDRFSPLAKESDAKRFALKTDSHLVGLWKRNRSQSKIENIVETIRNSCAEKEKNTYAEV